MCANDLHAAQLCCFKYIGARTRSLSGDMHGPDVACSKARSYQGSASPRSGRHPHSRCNWPKLAAGAPCCLHAPLSLVPSSRFSLAPADCANVLYHNVCPVALHHRCRTISPAPLHQVNLDVSRSLMQVVAGTPRSNPNEP
jgi:hypothetical protein